MANEELIALSEVKKKLTAIRQYFTGYHSTEQDKLARAVVKLCIEEIDKLKPVDAVEVVRCKDCKYWEDGYFGYCTKIHSAMEYDAFCSNGERKDNE